MYKFTRIKWLIILKIGFTTEVLPVNILESDLSRIAGIKRDPVKVRNIFRSIARNTATMVAKTAIVKDIKEYDGGDITRPTLYEYLDALERLMIIENQPAWSIHIIF